MADDKDAFRIPIRTKVFVYTTHAFTTMGARMWWFGIGLFLIDVAPDSLRLTATYGFTNGGAILLLAAVVGDLIDQTSRLRAARVALVLNNITIILCCALILVVLNYRPDIEAAWSDGKLLTLVFVFVIMLTIFSNLCNLGRTLVMERDWIVEICGRDKDTIATTSATFRVIDLCTKVVAPLGTGQIMTYTSPTGGAIFIACWNFVALFIEYYLVWKVYSIVPSLHTKSSDSMKEPSGSDEEKQQMNVTDNNNATNVHDTETEKQQESDDAKTSPGFGSRLFSSFIALYRGLKYYKSYDVCTAGVAIAFLYFTVLGFDNITMGYAKTQGMTESTVGILVGGAAIFGLIASISYPFIRRRIGLIRTGVVALTCQVSCLCFCIISLWMPGGTFDTNRTWSDPLPDKSNCSMPLSVVPSTTIPNTVNVSYVTGNATFCDDLAGTDQTSSRASVIMLMIGITGARFGVWLIDLTVAQLFMETIEEKERGIVNGFQSSLNKLMDMLKFILIMFIPDPSMFGYPAIVSFCFICSAWLLYARFAKKRNGFLCCE